MGSNAYVASYRKNAGALQEVLKSFAYLEPKIER
jgi:hypothetical protein